MYEVVFLVFYTYFSVNSNILSNIISLFSYNFVTYENLEFEKIIWK